MNVDEFIGKVKETEDNDIFTQRVFYHLNGKMFAQMCELLKKQEEEIENLKQIVQSMMESICLLKDYKN